MFISETGSLSLLEDDNLMTEVSPLSNTPQEKPVPKDIIYMSEDIINQLRIVLGWINEENYRSLIEHAISRLKHEIFISQAEMLTLQLGDIVLSVLETSDNNFIFVSLGYIKNLCQKQAIVSFFYSIRTPKEKGRPCANKTYQEWYYSAEELAALPFIKTGVHIEI